MTLRLLIVIFLGFVGGIASSDVAFAADGGVIIDDPDNPDTGSDSGSDDDDSEPDDSWIGSIISGFKSALIGWITDLLEGVRSWIVEMFQEMLDEILELLIKLLPKEISDTKFTMPDAMLNALAFVGCIFPIQYAATLLMSYGTFKLSFWIYRKCLGFFGLIKPKFD